MLPKTYLFHFVYVNYGYPAELQMKKSYITDLQKKNLTKNNVFSLVKTLFLVPQAYYSMRMVHFDCIVVIV